MVPRHDADEGRAAGREPGLDPAELREWTASFREVARRGGDPGARRVLGRIRREAGRLGVADDDALTTAYVNTIPLSEEPRYPGRLELERRIEALIRWNALAMVVRANRRASGIGGHLSTYASAATLFEVGFHHFFRAPTEERLGDVVYLQGHASPGVYARAFLEGRLDEENLDRFRRECGAPGGLSSYPHPWLMPDFWEMPTVSMGLSPIMAVYQARFLRYLRDRGLLDREPGRVWCLLGDGECDEPESLGALPVAGREGLDNLTFVVNCNLQRLDGPVRGNGKLVQELEAIFRGAGWNVIKVVWGGDWDPLLAADRDGALVERMESAVDGDFQKYAVEDGAYMREHFFGTSPRLQTLVDHLSDDQLRHLARGGHDPKKVYAAYRAAVRHEGAPTVILAKTLKGFGLGDAIEGRNATHQQKTLDEAALREFRARFGIPIPDEDVVDAAYCRPGPDSPERVYLAGRRESLGGPLPARRDRTPVVEAPGRDSFEELLAGSERPLATTMALVRQLGRLLRHEGVGRHLVPIIPDEARTFGMDALFRQYGIYSSAGQRYEPVDKGSLLYYREARDGQILEEGISEAGSMASFIAAGTAGAAHGVPTIPFFTFYSMFGFQRVGDLIWAAADARARGFLCGGTAGRTTLDGEGLQHQDGHSQLLAAAVPGLRAYDPAWGYELAVILRDGLRRMLEEREDALYYLTVYNETYPMPGLPEGHEEAILQGLHRVSRRDGEGEARPQLFGSGPILREVLRAQERLAEDYGVGSDVWSATSWSELRRDALACERWNRLHPGKKPRRSHLGSSLAGVHGPFVAATDYLSLVPDQVARWIPGRLVSLGTDGFGRSDTRTALRRHFEVDAEHVAYAALAALTDEDAFSRKKLSHAARDLGIDPEAPDPATA